MKFYNFTTILMSMHHLRTYAHKENTDWCVVPKIKTIGVALSMGAINLHCLLVHA